MDIKLTEEQKSKIAGLYNIWAMVPLMTFAGGKYTASDYAKKDLLDYLDDILKLNGVPQDEIDSQVYQFDIDEFKFIKVK